VSGPGPIAITVKDAVSPIVDDWSVGSTMIVNLSKPIFLLATPHDAIEIPQAEIVKASNIEATYERKRLSRKADAWLIMASFREQGNCRRFIHHTAGDGWGVLGVWAVTNLEYVLFCTFSRHACLLG
jgi:hypothetical protein